MTRSPRRLALVVGIDHYPYVPSEQPLQGCVADARLAVEVLRNRFGFAEPTLLTDGDATRSALLAALHDLAREARSGDTVAFHFSGHGSQRHDPDGDEEDGLDETLVPTDSGRGEHENRDVGDDRIHRWLAGLVAKGVNPVLILDSCHSGTAHRVPFQRVAVRRAPPGVADAEPPIRPQALRPPKGASGWLSPQELGRGFTLLAACRDEEQACELPEHHHGAFSWFLYRELDRVRDEATFHQVFERTAARVSARFPRQTPQIEGARDRRLFDTVVRPRPLLFPVTGRVGNVARLDAGSLSGLTVGSELAVHPADVREVDDESPRLGRIRLTRVEGLSAAGEVVDETGAVAAGDRARVERIDHGDALLPVIVTPPPGSPADTPADPRRADGDAPAGSDASLYRRLLQQVRNAPLLRAVEGDAARTEGVQIVRLEARETCPPDSPARELGPLAAPSWVILAEDGRPLEPPVEEGPGTVEDLVRRLERWARYRRALEIGNEGAAALDGEIRLTLYHQPLYPPPREPGSSTGTGVRDEGCDGEDPVEEGAGSPPPAGPSWRELQDGDGTVLRDGDRVGLELAHDHPEPLHLAVLSFGLDGTIALVYPPPGTEGRLPPGRSVRVAMRPEGPALRVRLPAFGGGSAAQPAAVPGTDPGATAGAAGRRSGREHLKVFATTRPVDFSVLTQEIPRVRSAVRASPAHPLDFLLRQASMEGRKRLTLEPAEPVDAWGTVLRSFTVG